MKKNVLTQIFAYLSIAILFISCNDNDTQRIDATGTIEAVEIRIAPKVGAHVSNIFIEEGSSVREGDTLVVLDHSYFDIQLRQAMAGIELAEAQLNLMLQGARDEDIRSAEEGLRQAEAHLQIAREDFRRVENLYEASSMSKKQLDDAEARHTVATAQYNTARQNLEKVRNLFRPEERQAQRARLEQAKATAELLSKNIEDSYIVSPVNGVITNKIVERGELVRQGTPVAVVSKLDTVRLMIYLSTVDVGRIRLGQDVDVTIDAYHDKRFTGIITYISPSSEFTPRNIQTKEERVKQVFGVRVEIPNPDGVLKPGLPADASVVAQIE
jgi:HlyD family secretion protein